ncbi:hypothetical protein B0H13DRAFT_1982118, partial [Mycena leptocephala]
MRWSSRRLLPLLLSTLSLVSANTEITNFAAPLRADAPALRGMGLGWPILTPRTQTRWTLPRAPLGTPLEDVCSESVSVRVRSTSANTNDSDPDSNAEKQGRCPYELWLVLDLPDGDDARYTLRLSWAASTPTDFALDVFDPLEAGALALAFRTPPTPIDGHVEENVPRTRRKYARIRAVDAGVRTPGPVWVPSLAALLGLGTVDSTTSAETSGPQTQNNGEATQHSVEATQAQAEPVEFILTLEPLLLGVLPASLLPFLITATAVLLALAAPGSVLARVQRGVEGLVREARRELEGEKGRRS